MKKLFILLFTLLCLINPIKVYGEDMPIFDDEAELLEINDRLSLGNYMKDVSDKLGVTISIVTKNGIDTDIQSFADDYYDSHYTNPDGIILVLDMRTREWYVSTVGIGIDYISDYEIDYIVDDMLNYLANDDYYNGFRRFVDGFDYYYHYDDTSDIEEYNDQPIQEKKFGFVNIGISTVFGLIASFICGFILKGQLKSVAPKVTANDYGKNFVITGYSDFYLGSHVSKTPIIRNNNHSNGSSHGNYGSGHNTHVSSSGVSHGGHGGHF